MPTSACTSYYTTTVTGFLPGSGASAGNVVTFTTPKPVWTDNNSEVSLQCNSVAMGGFNGLNN